MRLNALLICAALIAVSQSGCGDQSGTIPVSGKVTFNGGPPPRDGTLSFVPLETAAGTAKRPGRGRFDTDGTFEATSFKPGDGLLPGRYGVSISCRKPAPTDLGDLNQYSYVKQGFKAPELVVDESQSSIAYDLDIPADQMNQPP